MIYRVKNSKFLMSYNKIYIFASFNDEKKI